MHGHLMIDPLLLRPPLPQLHSTRIIVYLRVLLAYSTLFGPPLEAVGTLNRLVPMDFLSFPRDGLIIVDPERGSVSVLGGGESRTDIFQLWGLLLAS